MSSYKWCTVAYVYIFISIALLTVVGLHTNQVAAVKSTNMPIIKFSFHNATSIQFE